MHGRSAGALAHQCLCLHSATGKSACELAQRLSAAGCARLEPSNVTCILHHLLGLSISVVTPSCAKLCWMGSLKRFSIQPRLADQGCFCFLCKTLQQQMVWPSNQYQGDNSDVCCVICCARIIEEALYLARTSTPGSVLVDVPKDIQQQLAVPDWSTSLFTRTLHFC